MGNSIFNLMNSNSNNSNFLAQFNQFRSMFSGNPQQQVQQLLQSGRMTQEQFKQLAEQATELQKLIR